MPNRRRMAETVAILIHSASSSPGDRSSNGRQPVILTGRLSALPFHNGVPDRVAVVALPLTRART